ncbi:hypothetical protein ANN_15834 [Periplaneta americana]|uniref:Uncharacterized protein n=1 Tax=Periplaneta americana TaxID=6978 RepID=A0ABQ8SHB1_PERAM|nr:hypothetical protein ANN_15834 [Periplaneta americana]
MFLKTAEALQIRGLAENAVSSKKTDDQSSPAVNSPARNSEQHSRPSSPLPEKRKRKSSGNCDISGGASDRFHSDSQPQRNKSSGVMSGERGGHQIGLLRPILRSGKVSVREFRTSLQCEEGGAPSC